MNTAPVYTSHLTGRALAYAVAKATGQPLEILPSEYRTGPRLFARQGRETVRYRPDLDPAQAWPLLVKYGQRCRLHLDFQCTGASYLEAGIRTGHTANDMLTAALRALVSLLLGPQVDIPTELLDAGQFGEALNPGDTLTASVDVARDRIEIPLTCWGGGRERIA